MRRAAILAALLGVGLVLPAAAQAAYGPGADPVSVSYARLEQGDDSTLDADITPDGRYVAIQTRATNFFADSDPDPPGVLRRGGIFRFDRATRALDFVADGDEVSSADGSLVLRGAASPSISDDGSKVVFSTAQQLVPQDTNDNIDVYVRDMNVPVGTDRKASGAYTLVSARDGSTTPASYAPRSPVLPGRNPGTDVTPNVAISGDGNRVAFRSVELADDLPASGSADTPPGQIFVRDIAARRTYLMTAQSGTSTPAGGATGPAVLSGDGSTAVWVGGNAAQQTRFLPGERTDDQNHYYLWRRVDTSTTRRVTGMADPDDPSCGGGGVTLDPLATGPCYGPLTSFEEDSSSIATAVPAVSTDGYRVAFLTSQGARPTSTNQIGLDAFLTNMAPGVSRKAGTVELTRDPYGGDQRSVGSIQGLAMSADGQHLVMATARSSFVLPLLASLGPFRVQSDTIELYMIDLAAATIDRVVRSTSGGDASSDAGIAPTTTADGSVVAFTSLASNLFLGDGNARADAFVATRVVPRTSGGGPIDDSGGTSDTPFTIDPPADLDVSLKRRTDGGLDVTVVAPGPGVIQLAASASVAGTRSIFALRASTTKATVASASKTVTKAGKVTIALKLASKYSKLLKKATRVAATVRTTFVPKAGGSTMSDTETSSFKRPTPKKKPTKKKSTKKSPKANKK